MENVKNCLVAQSGGPTAVINSSACGIIEQAFNSGEIDKVFGAQNGIAGVLKEDLILLNSESAEEIALLKLTPASALGSCRFKLGDTTKHQEEYKRIFEVFQAHNIGYFFYIGGNDSMDTVNKIAHYAEQIGYDLKCMGVPKTVDNDLPEVDHTPGFGSCAKFIAASVKEVCLDANAYDYPTVTIIELMGRNAGWITAASALARVEPDDAPHYIYLPEVAFEFEQFEKDLKMAIETHGFAVAVISEGIKYATGKYIAEGEGEKIVTDSFGHKQLGGAADVLKRYVESNGICKKVRIVNYASVQRCAAHWKSEVDNNEAYLCGMMAVKYALDGHSGKMVGLIREPGETYSCETKLIDLDKVANYEKKLPLEWIVPNKNNVTKEYLNYVRPLIKGTVEMRMEGGVPRFSRLNKNKVTPVLPKWK